MKQEQQVVSLDLAKRLKELGVKQESLFWWYPNYVNIDMAIDAGDRSLEGQIHGWDITYLAGEMTTESPDLISAFTVAELGELLPSFIDDEAGMHHYLEFEKYNDGLWHYYYGPVKPMETETNNPSDTEADARAKMLCYLLENKLIDPASVV